MLFFISVMGFSYVVKDSSSLSSEHLCRKQVASDVSPQCCHLLCTVLLSALLTSVCWRWRPTLHSWSSTRKPLRSTSRWGHCYICNNHCYLLLETFPALPKKLGKKDSLVSVSLLCHSWPFHIYRILHYLFFCDWLCRLSQCFHGSSYCNVSMFHCFSWLNNIYSVVYMFICQ